MCILEHQSPNGLLKFRFFHLHLRKQNKIKQQGPPSKLQIQTPNLEAAPSLAGFLLVLEDFLHFMPLSLCRHRRPCPESLVLSPADHSVVQNPISVSAQPSSKRPSPLIFASHILIIPLYVSLPFRSCTCRRKEQCLFLSVTLTCSMYGREMGV